MAHPSVATQQLLCFLLVAAVGSVEHGPRFLVVSSPSERNIQYAKVWDFHSLTLPESERPEVITRVLIDGALRPDTSVVGTAGVIAPVAADPDDLGLRSPQGVAIYEGATGTKLFVADCEATNIYSYDLWCESNGDELKVGKQMIALEGIAGGVRGLTVDGLGNLFFTVPASGQIQMITVQDLNAGKKASKVLYSITGTPTVSSPGGVAADNYFVYWTNQEGGGTVGSVAKGFERTDAPSKGGYPMAIAKNSETALDVCLARDNVFFTSQDQFLFATKKSGGAIVEVSRALSQPRGCAYDMDNSLFVADSGANAIFSLPANMKSLRAVPKLTKVANVTSPCQIAVYSPSTLRSGLGGPRQDSGGHRVSGTVWMSVLALLFFA